MHNLKIVLDLLSRYNARNCENKLQQLPNDRQLGFVICRTEPVRLCGFYPVQYMLAGFEGCCAGAESRGHHRGGEKGRGEPVRAHLARGLRAPHRHQRVSHLSALPRRGLVRGEAARRARGLRHAPINEQGVVFLFGIVAYELGFIVEAVHAGYPDCEAKRRLDADGERWLKVRIEFEFRSRNFVAHGHDPAACDVIVCWEHDWPDCPLEVVELRRVIDELVG
jgi:hypothetical protein